MAWVLGIDTSSTDLGVGLFNDATPVASYSRYRKNSHAEHIAEVIAMLLKNNGLAPDAVTHIALAAGPGSFTGLRIGFAFAKGFAFSSNVKILPLSSLYIFAHAARLHSGTIISMIDARRDEVFSARFSCTQGVVERLTPDRLLPVEEAFGSIGDADAILTDTMGYAKSTVFNIFKGRRNVFPVERFPIQRGLICAEIGSFNLDYTGLWQNASTVLPDYLRAFTPQTSIKGQTP